jgi:hypothetical protein
MSECGIVLNCYAGGCNSFTSWDISGTDSAFNTDNCYLYVEFYNASSPLVYEMFVYKSVVSSSQNLVAYGKTYNSTSQKIIFEERNNSGLHIEVQFGGSLSLVTVPFYMILQLSTDPASSGSSSQSVDFSSYSSSTSSTFIEPEITGGVTYYNNFRDLNSIANITTDNDTLMQFSGFFDKDWSDKGLQFDYFGYGLKKTINNKGAIFCWDASKLFSFDSGYIGMVLSLPHKIENGIYAPLKNSNSLINENILFGVNVGQNDISYPGIYSALSGQGIEFNMKTAACDFSMFIDNINVDANEDFFLEFAWDRNKILGSLATMVVKVNDIVVKAGNPSIGTADMSNLNFYVLNTPSSYSNLECTIKKLITATKIL